MMNALTQLSPQFQQELQPLMVRWAPFVQKVNTRVNDVIAEANEGMDGLIAAHATDFGPMGAAFGALQARFNGIGTKVSEASEQVEQLVWEIMFRDGLSPQDSQVLGQIHTQINREEQYLRDQVEMRYQELNMRKSADWSRALHKLAEGEMQRELNCSQCGSPFQVKVWWKSSNETCPHCNAVNSLSPGMATVTYYGQGSHTLSHEAAWAAWQAEQQAQAAYDRLRHPTAYDFEQKLSSSNAYWTAYYQHYQQMHPGFADAHGSIEAAVEAKMKHHTEYDQPIEKQNRDFMGHMMHAAGQGNAQQVQQMAGALPDGIDLDDCAEAAVERHNTQAATLILNVRYDLEDEDEPRAEWIQEQLKEMYERLRDR
jgi:hypothetical protein